MRIPKKALLLAVQREVNVADAFSTTLYTGNGSTQTINNGIYLAGEGGLVWIKSRSAATDHQLFDTNRGVANELASNSTAAQVADADTLTAFNVDGFNIGADSNVNTGSATYASWTFRQAPKFFDIVQYTGDGTSGRQIAHDLGVAPGMIIVKCLTQTYQWAVYHRTQPATDYALLNATVQFQTSTGFWAGVEPTDSNFSVGTNPTVNGVGESYIAYLFAHDPSDSGIIQCGSYTHTVSNDSVYIDLGWVPQYVLVKRSDASGNWFIVDAERGFPFEPDNSSVLQADTSNAEQSNTIGLSRTSSGFVARPGSLTPQTYIYMAVRAPE